MSIAQYKALIDESFSEDQDQARRVLYDMANVFNFMDESVRSGTVDAVSMCDAIVTALYGMSNNPLGAIVSPMFRTIVLEVTRSGTHDFAKRFLGQAIPALATLMNGKSPLDYKTIHEATKKALK